VSARRTFLAALLAVFQPACTEIVSFDDYEFRDRDAGPPGSDAGPRRDGGTEPDTDAGPLDGGFDACFPTETCNGLDDDCDGETDEDFDLTSDEANCGACGSACGGLFCADSQCVRATEITASWRHTCALLSNGEVWCWVGTQTASSVTARTRTALFLRGSSPCLGDRRRCRDWTHMCRECGSGAVLLGYQHVRPTRDRIL
jgi:hypothetical protein